MKKSLIAATLAISAFSAMSASANNGFYVSGDIGASIVDMHDTKASLSYAGESGTEKFKNKNKGVFSGGVAAGYNFNDEYKLPVRLEFATTFRGNAEGSQSYSDGDETLTVKNKVRMDTYMVNAYYDFYNSSDFTPYVTAGIGMSHLKHSLSAHVDDESVGMSKKSNNFAWGLGAGVAYAVTSNISIDASYRYVDGGKVSGNKDIDGVLVSSKTKASSNDLMVGVSYKF